VFNACDFFPVLAFVGSRNLVADELFAGSGMPALGDPREMLGTNWADRIHCRAS
jgi:hypothetical protein